MKKYSSISAIFVVLFLAGVCSAQAGTKTWKATTTGDWFTAGNWVEGSDYPRAGDDVVITNAGAAVLLTNSTEYLGSLTLRAPVSSLNMLIFSNWNTTLSATNITIQTNGVVTMPPAFTTNTGVMSNNIYIVCSNLTIDAGGKIDVKGKGYSGATNQNLNGFGPGRGLGGSPGGGAGYGSFGYGSIGLFGLPYGSAEYPFQPGSGGGTYNTTDGGSGGGAVRIEATGTLTVNGAINADGNNGDTSGGGGGGGSGGGIYIACLKLAGTGGQVTAIGGNGDNEDTYVGGASGGRIAVHYNTAAQTSAPAIRFLCSGGVWGASRFSVADMGTLWLTNSTFITKDLMLSGHKTQVIIPGFTSWTVDTLTVSNTTIRFSIAGFQLNVTGDMMVGTNGSLGLDGSVAYLDYTLIPYPTLSGLTSAPALNVGGNLLLTNGGTLYMYSAMTNSAAINYGARIAVSGNIVVATNAVFYLQSHPTNGGSVYITANNLTVNTGGVINAVGRGYAGGPSGKGGFGQGAPASSSTHSGCGAGYGGTGGRSYASISPGNPYGLTNGPLQAGSGGAGGTYGGSGGGLIWIAANNTVTVNGTVKADGTGGAAGGGSGGGIFITCRTIGGSASGSLSAIGSGAGGSWSGGGGGGRIAIWSIRNNALGLINTNVTGGLGGGEARGSYGTLADGTPGSVFWGQLPVPGTVFFGR